MRLVQCGCVPVFVVVSTAVLLCSWLLLLVSYWLTTNDSTRLRHQTQCTPLMDLLLHNADCHQLCQPDNTSVVWQQQQQDKEEEVEELSCFNYHGQRRRPSQATTAWCSKSHGYLLSEGITADKADNSVQQTSGAASHVCRSFQQVTTPVYLIVLRCCWVVCVCEHEHAAL